jgi:hypothetical protein
MLSLDDQDVSKGIDGLLSRLTDEDLKLLLRLMAKRHDDLSIKVAYLEDLAITTKGNYNSDARRDQRRLVREVERLDESSKNLAKELVTAFQYLISLGLLLALLAYKVFL